MKYIQPHELKAGKLYKTNGFYDPYVDNRFETCMCLSEEFVDIDGDWAVEVLRANGKIYEFTTESCDFCELEID